MATKVMVAPAIVRGAESKPTAAGQASPPGPSARPRRRKSSIYDGDGNEVFITLLCLKCRQMRPLSQFGLRKMADGAIRNQPWCRPCRSAAGTGKGRTLEAADSVDSAETVDPSTTVTPGPPTAVEPTPTAIEPTPAPARDGHLAAQVAAALAAGLGR